MDTVDFASLESSVEQLRSKYSDATPYPHVVIDNLLLGDAVQAAYDEFDAVDDKWTKYLHINERKFANTQPTTWGPALAQITADLQSERFQSFLVRLSGIDDLIADQDLDGGGLHRSTTGGYLNVHADFTAHHVHQNWRRRINLILYLNRTWEEDWGGELELWSSDMSHCEEKVAPIGNRAIIFSTTDDSFHGHPDPMTCPEGMFRQSLALYYFTRESDRHILSTNYRPRPDDGLRSVGIVLDRQLLHVYDVFKRRLRLSDGSVSRALGRLDRFRK